MDTKELKAQLLAEQAKFDMPEYANKVKAVAQNCARLRRELYNARNRARLARAG